MIVFFAIYIPLTAIKALILTFSAGAGKLNADKTGFECAMQTGTASAGMIFFHFCMEFFFSLISVNNWGVFSISLFTSAVIWFL